MVEAIGSSDVGIGMWNPLLFKLSDVNSPICVPQYFLLVYLLALHSLFDFIEVTIHAVICEIPTFWIHCLTFIFSAVDLNFKKFSYVYFKLLLEIDNNLNRFRSLKALQFQALWSDFKLFQALSSDARRFNFKRFVALQFQALSGAFISSAFKFRNLIKLLFNFSEFSKIQY